MRHLVYSTFAFVTTLICKSKERERERERNFDIIHGTPQSIAQSQSDRINGSIIFKQSATNKVSFRVTQMTHFKGVPVSNPGTQLHKNRPGLRDYWT